VSFSCTSPALLLALPFSTIANYALRSARTTPEISSSNMRARCTCAPLDTSMVNCMKAVLRLEAVFTPITLIFSRANTSEMSRNKP